VPHALLHNLKHNKVLHERNMLLTVETVPTDAMAEQRLNDRSVGDDFFAVTLRFGFMEDMDVPQALRCDRATTAALDMMDTTFFPAAKPSSPPPTAAWRCGATAVRVPATQCRAGDRGFFRIPGNRLIELGTQVEI
jgi:KUP system potassium uptake protein